MNSIKLATAEDIDEEEALIEPPDEIVVHTSTLVWKWSMFWNKMVQTYMYYRTKDDCACLMFEHVLVLKKLPVHNIENIYMNAEH